jgi:hypothetical protein
VPLRPAARLRTQHARLIYRFAQDAWRETINPEVTSCAGCASASAASCVPPCDGRFRDDGFPYLQPSSTSDAGISACGIRRHDSNEAPFDKPLAFFPTGSINPTAVAASGGRLLPDPRAFPIVSDCELSKIWQCGMSCSENALIRGFKETTNNFSGYNGRMNCTGLAAAEGIAAWGRGQYTLPF